MKTRLFFVSFLSLLFFLLFTISVHAVELPGLEETAKAAHINRAVKDPSIVATQIVQWILSFVGVIFLVLMIYGGFTWMTAGGNQESIGKAQKTVVAAIIGLVIVISAYAITTFVGTTFGA